jgi:hypothetical protein
MIDGTKLASLESVFQYEHNKTNCVQYNQDFVAQYFRPKFVLKYVYVLIIKTEVVKSKLSLVM